MFEKIFVSNIFISASTKTIIAICAIIGIGIFFQGMNWKEAAKRILGKLTSIF